LTSGRADVPVRVASVSPVGINMRRVATAMRIIDRAEDGPLDRDVVDRQLDAARALKPSNDVVFTIACATGAGALAVVFGVTDPGAVLWVAVSAAVGGLIRRTLGRFGIGTLSQAFVAATIAGLIGAAAMHLDLGAAPGLVAVCPGMVLVPGPHILNGALDLLALRITLGIARLGYATLILLAIAAGLILGLRLGGQTLSVTGSGTEVPLYVDILAAGVAAASYPGVLLDALPHDRLAGSGRNAGPRCSLVCDGGMESGSADGRTGGMPAGRHAVDSSFALPADAFCRNRICFRRRPGPRRIRVPDAQRHRPVAEHDISRPAGRDGVGCGGGDSGRGRNGDRTRGADAFPRCPGLRGCAPACRTSERLTGPWCSVPRSDAAECVGAQWFSSQHQPREGAAHKLDVAWNICWPAADTGVTVVL